MLENWESAPHQRCPNGCHRPLRSFMGKNSRSENPDVGQNISKNRPSCTHQKDVLELVLITQYFDTLKDVGVRRYEHWGWLWCFFFYRATV